MTVLVFDAGGQLLWDEADIMRNSFRIHLYGYVRETASSETDGVALRDSLNLLDDIFKVVLANRTLSGKEEYLEVESWDVTAGDPDVPFGEIAVVLRTSQIVDTPSLGQ
ncbi:MAG TPA: hypothetical protein VFG76_06870 [Candidatus Polarisedimenticolia bacterium]|nr:hypothetical protein [Candidatus Polarisedimenticolia bacterium]